MRPTRSILILLLALAPMSIGASDSAFLRPPVVLIHMRSSHAIDEQVLQSLLVDSVTLELSDRGMEVLTGTSPVRGQEEILDLAESEQADFALVGVYTLKEEDVLLEMQWLEVNGRALVAQASRQGPLDLSFDSIVADAVGELLAGQEGSLANLPPRAVKLEEHASVPMARAEGREIALDLPLPLPEPEPETEMPSVEQAEQPQPQPAAQLDQQPPAPAPAESPPDVSPPAIQAAAPQAQPSAERAKPLRRLAFSLGTAPLIATFNATKYFEMGLSVQIAAHFRIPLPGGFLGFGLAAAADGFRGKGAYAEADFLLIPIGLDVQYGTVAASFIDFFIHANGGPAIFAARAAGGNPLAKVVPFVTGGVGVTVSMGDGFGISLDGSYTAFFDSPSPIMGYAPSVSLLVRV